MKKNFLIFNAPLSIMGDNALARARELFFRISSLVHESAKKSSLIGESRTTLPPVEKIPSS
ncbi:MAG TPA: hypothetical protein IAC73_04410 [Candidatus Limadaptatus stercoripullorum]|uniref:Uncharacterized protein n=1 Tax=Candidatus Limadaptatus stercoripullorum TaxID=2840846 RepID=A0A9D1SVW4_9FIRM|nr:hypothetical protein [Candidatus Limadaptatus stercoripullorum]